MIAALRLPADTKEQAETRRTALEEGYKTATLVPLRSAELCLDALRLARRCVALCMSASISDVGVAAFMARAGLRGSVCNVRINLGEIADAAWVEDVRSQLGALLDEGRRLEDKVEDRLAAVMKT